MPQEDAIVDKLLTGVSQKVVPHGFIGNKILTPLSVVQSTGKIGKYGNTHLRILANTQIIGKGRYPVLDNIVRESDVYDVEMHGLQNMITAKEYANVERPFAVESDLVEELTTVLKLGAEKALADTLTDTGVLTNNKTLVGNAQYNNYDHDDSDPLGDALEARSSIRDAIGHAPNFVAMAGKTFDTLSFHPKILDKLGYKDNRAGSLSEQEIARALKVDQILVGEAIYNAGKEGQADDIQPVWGDDMVYGYRATNTGLKQKTLGYDVTMKGMGRLIVQKWKENTPRGAKSISVDDNYDHLITDVNCAFLIKGAIA